MYYRLVSRNKYVNYGVSLEWREPITKAILKDAKNNAQGRRAEQLMKTANEGAKFNGFTKQTYNGMAK
uniref:Uncharacterized protein n=1 Tax=Glossina morsitans morsitans TaxID=37546 RepID=A0A1B0F9F0_GLOMM